LYVTEIAGKEVYDVMSIKIVWHCSKSCCY